MVRKIIGILGIIVLCCGTAFAQKAQERSETGLSSWLKDLQKKISQVTAKKAPTMTTGVAGVRGAKEASKSKLYWKGKKGDEAVTEEELTSFKASVELAASGDNAGAAKGIEAFMQKYPDSPLIPEAKKTLDLVKAEGK